MTKSKPGPVGTQRVEASLRHHQQRSPRKPGQCLRRVWAPHSSSRLQAQASPAPHTQHQGISRHQPPRVGRGGGRGHSALRGVGVGGLDCAFWGRWAVEMEGTNHIGLTKER